MTSMASGWMKMKSLQCKSRAVKDVILPTFTCRKTAQSIKDVIHTSTRHRGPSSKPKPKLDPKPISSAPPLPPPRSADPLFPALTELPDGHPSRNVVEIIFHSSWSNKSFPGRIEMIFKVHNGPRTVSRFEEYRDAVKTRAGLLSVGTTWEENARCVADGNEMMRFYCLGVTGGVHEERVGTWVFSGGKGAAICTFSGSGRAHDSAGGGCGMRAMVVCRVVAGRVSRRIQFDSLFDGRIEVDSVSGENGELLVFDPRAVLSCFLIIYKL